jgi:hypothetical protein
MNIDNIDPIVNKDDDDENDETINYDLEEDDEVGTAEKGDLKYNKDADSYELDVNSEDPEYDHDDPYNSAVKDGGDSISTYDEANPLAVDEYMPNETIEDDVDTLGMHIDNGQSVEVDPIDEVLSRTPEDDRDDLDEEGYPKNDMPMK